MTTHVTCKSCKYSTVATCDHCATWHSETTGHEVETRVELHDEYMERRYGKTVSVSPPWWMRGQRC